MCSYLLCVLNDCLSWLVTYCSKSVVASQISAQLKRSTQWKSEFSIDSAIIKVGTKVAWIDVLMVGVLRYAMSVWSVCWVDWENLQQETASIRDKFAAWGDFTGRSKRGILHCGSITEWLIRPGELSVGDSLTLRTNRTIYSIAPDECTEKKVKKNQTKIVKGIQVFSCREDSLKVYMCRWWWFVGC